MAAMTASHRVTRIARIVHVYIYIYIIIIHFVCNPKRRYRRRRRTNPQTPPRAIVKMTRPPQRKSAAAPGALQSRPGDRSRSVIVRDNINRSVRHNSSFERLNPSDTAVAAVGFVAKTIRYIMYCAVLSCTI